MHKNKLLIPAVLCLITLSGCDSDAEVNSADDNEPTLASNDYTLDFKEYEVIESPMENSKGIYMTFDVTNDSESNIVPQDIFYSYLAIAQTTDTSVVYSTMPYHYLDAFGEDAESYNRMLDKSSTLHNQLLPGATVEASFAYELTDESLPVTIVLYDEETNDETDTYTFDID